MHTLIWNKNSYSLKSEDETQAESPGSKDRRPQKFQADKRKKVTTDIWKNFLKKGMCQPGNMDQRILESWQRCKQKDVDPGPRKCWDIIPRDRFERDCPRFEELSATTMKKFYDYIKGQGLLITVSNHEGYLLGTYGDYKTLLIADKLNFGPGANWSEESVGTNAIGTSLVTGRPMRVLEKEHYCQSHHAWNCAAAPIFDPLGSIIGCLDISGPAQSTNKNNLGLAIEAAKYIETGLYQAHLSTLTHQSNALVSTVFNSVLTGLVSVDSRGIIRNANPAAETLLSADPGMLEGSRATVFFNYTKIVQAPAVDLKISQRQGIPLQCRKQKKLLVQAHPIISETGRLNGCIISIVQCQHIHPVAGQLVGRGKNEEKTEKSLLKNVIGQSQGIKETQQRAARAARTCSNVLLLGESGSGKEVFSRAIHEASSRARKPFVPVNCGAIPQELIQSELFGYVEGAFTGSRRGGRAGKFEQANGGTLFLDEIGEMPLKMQVNLLRVLEDRQLTRVGGSKSVHTDVRIIAATNQDLAMQVTQGTFRQDLYYRLRVVSIIIPPLRERGEDVLLLANHFIRTISQKLDRPVDHVGQDFLDCLMAHDWPGNVRELVNAVEYALNMMPGSHLTAGDLPPEIVRCSKKKQPASAKQPFRLHEIEAGAIRQALDHFCGNISQAAQALGIGRNTLYKKIKQYGLEG